MKNSSCRHEQALLRCLKADNWDDSTQAHFKSCSICQEYAAVWKLMTEFSEETLREAPKMEYGLVWLKSYFVQKQAAQQRALRPLMIFQPVAGILIGLSTLIWSIWNQSELTDWFSKWTTNMNIETTNFEVMNLPLILTIFCGLLLLITVFSLASSAFFRED